MDELTQLLLGAQSGDRLALTVWIRRTQPEVWRLCAHLVGRAEADDLTQDVYVRAFRALPAFRAEASARTWLLSIARRTCADAIRGVQRRRKLMQLVQVTPPAEDHAATHALNELLVHLDDDRRAAFVLTQLLGLTYLEAAEACGCAVGTIRSRVARARADLIALMREEGLAEG